MTTIVHEGDADLAALAGATVAVVGYGNQGRPWALNLPGLGSRCPGVRTADATRERGGGRRLHGRRARRRQHRRRGVRARARRRHPRPSADNPRRRASSSWRVATRWPSTGSPRPATSAWSLLGCSAPEVRRCYEEGVGFITAVGVQADVTGTARARTMAVAKAIGGLRQGAIEMTAAQEAVLDLAVEQALSPALRRVSESFVQVMLEHEIPLEAVLTELFLSGEVERTYRLLRTEGYAAQMEHHSPVSQYGQLSRQGRYDHLDVPATMRDIVDGIASGRFADEWDTERDSGFARVRAAEAGGGRTRHRGVRERAAPTARRGSGSGRPRVEADPASDGVPTVHR